MEIFSAAITYMTLFINSVKAHDGEIIPHDTAVELTVKANEIIKTIRP